MWFTIAKNCETNSLNSDAMDSDLSNLPANFQAAEKTALINPTRARPRKQLCQTQRTPRISSRDWGVEGCQP
jgi:hypothetical protein